jgi:CheY-like chemotaxis protein/HPt (histidine-containing phosphotransfer) domain-containing protein
METNQKIIKEMILMLGHKAEIASNGMEAVSKFSNSSYDLIFMDCQMPIMDGFEATKKIRTLEQRGNKPQVPIVALTAGSNRQDRDRCKFVGMNYYLNKPFSISDIKDALVKHLGSDAISTREDAIEHTEERESHDTSNSVSTSAKVLNFSAIDNILEVERQTGKSILPSIFEGFVSQMEEKLVEINTNIDLNDYESTYRTAHAIKSMSANIGADRIRSISAEIEGSARSNSVDSIGNKLETLNSAYHEFVYEFKQEYF